MAGGSLLVAALALVVDLTLAGIAAVVTSPGLRAARPGAASIGRRGGARRLSTVPARPAHQGARS